MEHILLPVFDESGKPATPEVLEAEPEGSGRYLLLHSPAFVDGIARGDIIELAPELPRGFRVARRGGYLAIVLALPVSLEKERAQQLLQAEVVAANGVCEGGPGRALVFSIPVGAGFSVVEQIFVSFCASHTGSDWWFGNVYDPESGAALNWW